MTPPLQMVWLPCRVIGTTPKAVTVAVLDDTLRERTVHVPASLVKARREGALQVPKWWVTTRKGLPYDVS